MGDQGAYWQDRAGEEFFAPAPKVDAVDTVAAGDSFCAALAVSLDQGNDFPMALSYAVRVAGLSVTRSGAMPSLPYRHEIGAN
jgi:ribokinase